jgi:hypothetical protein
VGCYDYVPLRPPEPVPGTRLAADLTDSGADALGRYLGPRVARVDGRLMRMTPDTLVLSAFVVTDREGIAHFWKGEAVSLPRALVATLERRRLSVGRTATFAAGAIAGAVLVLRAFGIISSGSSSTMPPPTGQ